MATDIPAAYVRQFTTDWKHTVQQHDTRLADYVTIDNISGKEKRYQFMEPTTARPITASKAETTETEEVLNFRWVRTKGYDEVSWFDEFDEELLGEVPLPSSATMKKHTSAFARRKDDTIIAALGGDAVTGEDADQTTSLPATQTIWSDYKDLTTQGSSAESGTTYNLTIQKLMEAKRKLWGSEALDEQYGDVLCIAVTSNQLAGLLMDADKVQSSDYNTIRALAAGEIDSYGGFKFKRTERLLTSAEGVTARDCYAWVKDGITLAIGKDKHVYSDILAHRNHTRQLRTVELHGAVRMQEEKVVKIRCHETSASTT